MTTSHTWLTSALAGQRLGRPGASDPDPAGLVLQAQYEGVAALVDARLREHTDGRDALMQEVPDPLRQAFQDASRESALMSMLLEAEARRVLGAMAAADLPGLLLKGSALAHWAYPQPHLRACGDVDLLLPSREAAETLSAKLTASGYERATTSGELVAYELLCTRAVTPDWRVEVDIHWRLANSPLFSDAFTFAELMAESIPLPRLSPNARGLGPVHALLHACMHRALNLSIGVDDKLKWLYDLIVLMDVFTPADWDRMVRLAIDKKLAGVVLAGLEAAAATFHRDLSAASVAALGQAAAAEPLDATRLSDWGYMQRKTYEALPGMGLRLRWLWQRLWPSRDYMAYLYGRPDLGYAGLIGIRVRTAVRRFLG